MKAEHGRAGNVVNLEKEAGETLSLKEIQDSLEEHKPAALFLCQVSASDHIILLCAAAPLQSR